VEIQRAVDFDFGVDADHGAPDPGAELFGDDDPFGPQFTQARVDRVYGILDPPVEGNYSSLDILIWSGKFIASMACEGKSFST